ncbi:DUF3108 domain-containing protein [Herbaspirillum seropedicae]|uniref:DUF3108 domain-containing protein n=1 Tax=Herbaspirillum seropedicae TaxID=964 RepID=UPI003FCC7E1F
MTDVSHPPRRWPRLLVLITLTLLLHALLVGWGRRHIIAMNTPASENVLTVQLQTPPPPVEPVALPAPPPPAKTSAPRTRPARAPRPAAEPSIDPPDEPIRETVEPIYTAVPEAPHAMPAAPGGAGEAGAAGEAARASAADKSEPVPADTTGKQYRTDAPPSAVLDYDVTGTIDQKASYGSASLDWRNSGQHYRLEGEVSAIWVTWLKFSSEGELDAWGVSPTLYTEKKKFRSATNTHFNRNGDSISFSASETRYPRRGGEQDRGSLIWQLAAIGRGDPAQFQPGAVIDLFVAGVRDGEVWRMQVIGEEAIKLPIGTLQTWHVVRVPKPGAYEDRIDIWLAPQHEWYPARLRYTDPRPNGDVTELSLSELRR